MSVEMTGEQVAAGSAALGRIRVVLHSPLYGGNVGSICRAMANMGVGQLAISAPRTLNEKETRMMACHAYSIYENRQEYPSLPDAISDCGLVIGTTARGGLYRQHAKTARDWAPEIVSSAAAGNTVALVFGPEDNGLSNEDLAFCSHIIQIPTTETYESLNLSQAVLICLYEVFVACGVFEGRTEKSEEAPSAVRERMFEIWRSLLLDVGFMDEDKADHMMQGIRRIMARGVVTVDDAQILMGVARQCQWAAANREIPACQTTDA